MGSLRTVLEEDGVVAVVGEPKIGKTSLAALLTGALEAELGALVLYFDLRLDNPAVILEQLLDRASIPVRGSFHENLSLLVTLLGERRCCVFLDNFESALDEKNLCIVEPRLSQLIDTLLAARARSRSFVVLTCRYPVRTQTYNAVPVFPLQGIAEHVAIPYLVQEYGWASEDAKRIYELRAGNPLVFHVCSEAIQDRQRLGINFDDALRQVYTLGTKLTYGEHYESFTDVERFIVDIIALHPVGIPFSGIAHILRGEKIGLGLASYVKDMFRGVADIVPAGFPYADISNHVVQLYRRGAFAQTGWMLRLRPADRSYVYSQVQGSQKWLLLHRFAAQYYFSEAIRIRTKQARVKETWNEEMAEDYFTLNEFMFYHALRGGVLFWAGGALSQMLNRLTESKTYETLRHYYEELLRAGGFDLQLSPFQKAQAYLGYATCLRHLECWEEARRQFSQAEKCVERAEEPDTRELHAFALEGLGRMAAKLGDPPEQEIKLYERAMDSEPDKNDREYFETVEIWLADARKRLNACPKTPLS